MTPCAVKGYDPDISLMQLMTFKFNVHDHGAFKIVYVRSNKIFLCLDVWLICVWCLNDLAIVILVSEVIRCIAFH